MRHFDLVVIGAGSGNSIPGPALVSEQILVVDDGVHFGGTCLNVGCIPTKMFVHPAEIAHEVAEARHVLNATSGEIRYDWQGIRDRVFGRIDAISEGGEEYRASGEPNISLLREQVRLTSEHELESASGERITFDRLVIATGSRPRELAALPLGDRIHTNDTILRLDNQPERLAVIGGGAIACEFAAMFAGLGTQVVQIHRSELLRGVDGEVRACFTEAAARRWGLHLGTEVTRAVTTADGVTLTLSNGDELTVDHVLVAAGRVVNTDRLGTQELGFDHRENGALVVDEQQRVLRGGEPVPGIWAVGDSANTAQLKHVANHEARVAVQSILHDLGRAEAPSGVLGPIPLVVFSSPQIATFGRTLAEAHDDGLDAVEARCDYGATAWGWALADSENFVKIVAERGSGTLLGAHIIGPDAGILLQPLVQAASFGQSVHGLARGQYWPHPAATEIVENALLKLEEQL